MNQRADAAIDETRLQGNHKHVEGRRGLPSPHWRMWTLAVPGCQDWREIFTVQADSVSSVCHGCALRESKRVAIARGLFCSIEICGAVKPRLGNGSTGEQELPVGETRRCAAFTVTASLT